MNTAGCLDRCEHARCVLIYPEGVWYHVDSRLAVDAVLEVHLRDGALYQTFPLAETRRILRRLEFHYTPKHATWPNMVVIEIGGPRGQCLDRRIDDPKILISEIAAWQLWRNAAPARVKWMFTTEKARAKMGHIYPDMTKES
jgi:(2Fe-2S) ferredoxin